jgi:dienelactone hydrolase
MKQTVLSILMITTAILPTIALEIPFDQLKALYNYDRTLPLETKTTAVRERNAVKIFDLVYASPKGGRVTACLVVPAGAGPFPAILFGHWGYGTKTEFLPEAILYAESKAISLLVDAPWVRPEPWRKNIGNFNKPQADFDVFVQAIIDLRRGIDLLQTLPEVDPQRIVFVGHSYGAQMGAILAAVDKRIKAAALLAGVPSQSDIYLKSEDPDIAAVRKSIPRQALEAYLNFNSPLDAVQYVRHASPTPLLFQFARYERYFDEESMRAYAEAAAEPKEVRWYKTGHELNDLLALLDRNFWLQEKARLPSIVPAIERRLKIGKSPQENSSVPD